MKRKFVGRLKDLAFAVAAVLSNGVFRNES